MTSFGKEEYMTKYGKKEKLKAKSQAANIYFILHFLNSILPKIIYHCNHLCHFCHCISELDETFKHFASTDIDFSENLTVPVKYEPQSLYWCPLYWYIHSGISKTNGNKIYHAHFPDDHKTCSGICKTCTWWHFIWNRY